MEMKNLPELSELYGDEPLRPTITGLGYSNTDEKSPSTSSDHPSNAAAEGTPKIGGKSPGTWPTFSILKATQTMAD